MKDSEFKHGKYVIKSYIAKTFRYIGFNYIFSVFKLGIFISFGTVDQFFQRINDRRTWVSNALTS
jgi:hypothetical protein